MASVASIALASEDNFDKSWLSVVTVDDPTQDKRPSIARTPTPTRLPYGTFSEFSPIPMGNTPRLQRSMSSYLDRNSVDEKSQFWKNGDRQSSTKANVDTASLRSRSQSQSRSQLDFHNHHWHHYPIYNEAHITQFGQSSGKHKLSRNPSSDLATFVGLGIADEPRPPSRAEMQAEQFAAAGVSGMLPFRYLDNEDNGNTNDRVRQNSNWFSRLFSPRSSRNDESRTLSTQSERLSRSPTMARIRTTSDSLVNTAEFNYVRLEEGGSDGFPTK